MLYDELMRKRMAERVMSRAPRFSVDDPVQHIDNALLDKATAMYRERGEALAGSRQAQSSQQNYQKPHNHQGPHKWSGPKKLPWDGKRAQSYGQGDGSWKKHKGY